MDELLKISENPKIRPLVRDEYLASLGYRLLDEMPQKYEKG